MQRLEGLNILLAISEDGILRLVQTEADAHQAVLDGFTVYSPKDAYYYVQLEPTSTPDPASAQAAIPGKRGMEGLMNRRRGERGGLRRRSI